MGRTPTNNNRAYAWHRAALAGEKPPIHTTPECGWFARRLVKGGPLLPARIYFEAPVDAETGELTGDEILKCVVGGQERDPETEWLWLAERPISREKYAQMLDALMGDDIPEPSQTTSMRDSGAIKVPY